MNKIKIQVLFGFFMIAITILACSGSVSTAKISDAFLTTTSDEAGKTTVFTQDQPFYCIVRVSNAPDDTSLKAVWIAVNVDGVDPNMMIDEAELTTDGNSEFTFDLQNDMLWPTGNYKVEIYLNGELNKTLEFEVR